MNHNLTDFTQDVHRIVFCARTGTRIDHQHIMVLKSIQNRLFYLLIIIFHNRQTMRNASCLCHLSGEHSGIGINNIAFLRLSLRLDNLRSGWKNGHLWLPENFHLQIAAGQQHTKIHRADYMTCLQHHFSCHNIFSDGTDMIPARYRSENLNRFFIHFHHIFCHDYRIKRRLYRISGIHDFIVCTQLQSNRAAF